MLKHGYRMILLACAILFGFVGNTYSQQMTLNGYGTGMTVMISSLALAPNYDNYNSDSAFCRDCAAFYKSRADATQVLGQSLVLPADLQECHNHVLESLNAIAQAYRMENYFLVGIAKTALTVACLEYVDVCDKRAQRKNGN